MVVRRPSGVMVGIDRGLFNNSFAMGQVLVSYSVTVDFTQFANVFLVERAARAGLEFDQMADRRQQGEYNDKYCGKVYRAHPLIASSMLMNRL